MSRRQKKVGVLVGKFAWQVTPVLYKFRTKSQLCYVTFSYPPQIQLGMEMAIKVVKRSPFCGLNRFAFVKYHNAVVVKIMQNRASARLKGATEAAAIYNKETNPAFTSNKKQAGYRAVTPNREFGTPVENAIWRSTRVLNKLLQPTQEELVGKRLEKERIKAEEITERLEKAARIAQEEARQMEKFQNKKLFKGIKMDYRLNKREMSRLSMDWEEMSGAEKAEFDDSIRCYAEALYGKTEKQAGKE